MKQKISICKENDDKTLFILDTINLYIELSKNSHSNRKELGQ